MDHLDLTVVIPAYNEEKTIEGTVRDVAAYLDGLELTYEVLIVDDGSTDATLSKAKRLATAMRGARVCGYEENRGKGFAVRTGMLEAAGDRVLFTDADNSTPIQELPALMAALDAGSGVAIGSRAVRGAVRTIHQPFYREFGGKALNLFIQLFACPGIKDTQCGFKLFTREAAQSVFARCVIDRFSFDVEVLYLARKMGYNDSELPVHWANREFSRVNPLRDGLRMFSDIARIRLRRYQLPGARSQN